MKGVQTMFKWFQDVKTAEECKRRYYQLCKDYHPDNGGNIEKFKEIQNEFEVAWLHFKNIHKSSENKYYKDDSSVKHETSKEVREMLEKIAIFQCIEIEICGGWIWLTGNTFPYREELKNLGFRWSASKRRWYWAKDLDYKKYKKGKSMKQIRNKYGSEIYHNNDGVLLEG